MPKSSWPSRRANPFMSMSCMRCSSSCQWRGSKIKYKARVKYNERKEREREREKRRKCGKCLIIIKITQKLHFHCKSGADMHVYTCGGWYHPGSSGAPSLPTQHPTTAAHASAAPTDGRAETLLERDRAEAGRAAEGGGVESAVGQEMQPPRACTAAIVCNS